MEIGHNSAVRIHLFKEKSPLLARVDQWTDSYCTLILRGGIPRKVFHKHIQSCEIVEDLVDWDIRGNPFERDGVNVQSRYNGKAKATED